MFIAAPAMAQYPIPDAIAVRKATVMSEGAVLVAYVYQAKANAGKRLPTILLCNGRGGLGEHLRYHASRFAEAGYTALTFDYRGWGESAGRLIAADPHAEAHRDGRPFATEVIELRETVDPFEQSADIMAMIAWLAAEPEVDASRIGIWGTSFGGGLVLHAMINDARVKVMVAQVGAYDTRRTGQQLEDFRRQATQRARGELPYPGPRPREAGKLHGFVIAEKQLYWAPVEDASRVNRPVLIIDAANEDLFDTRVHGERVYERLGGPKERVVIPRIRHFDIYTGEPLQQAMKLAIGWYDKYLK
jgi:dienelactone hydrolase